MYNLFFLLVCAGLVDVRLISPCLSFLVPVRWPAGSEKQLITAAAVLRSVALYRPYFFLCFCTLAHPISSISLFSLIFRWNPQRTYLGSLSLHLSSAVLS
jgi:hypothetical protein